MRTGILVEQKHYKTVQYSECYICGKRVKEEFPDEVYLDRDNREVLDPKFYDTPEFQYASMPPVPIGKECRKKYPGIEKFFRTK